MYNSLTSQEDFSLPSLPDNNQKVSQADKLLQQSHTVYEETQRPREINQSSTYWTFSHELHQCAALWAGLWRKWASVQVELSSGEVKWCCFVCVWQYAVWLVELVSVWAAFRIKCYCNSSHLYFSFYFSIVSLFSLLLWSTDLLWSRKLLNFTSLYSMTERRWMMNVAWSESQTVQCTKSRKNSSTESKCILCCEKFIKCSEITSCENDILLMKCLSKCCQSKQMKLIVVIIVDWSFIS